VPWLTSTANIDASMEVVGVRTQVCIIGAGPAGLVLARLLERAGIASIVIERRSRSYVESRVRAGVLEHDTARLLDELGVGGRMRREGLVHRGVELRFDGEGHRIDLEKLTGKTITVYGQQEVVKDLIAARLDAGAPLLFEAEVTGVDGTAVAFRHEGAERLLSCDFVAGCDGSHGVSRSSVPTGALQVAERSYPYAWLGILARAPAANEELVYAYHERGFALHSMRTPEIVRLYLQVPPGTDLADWPDARIWDELRTRLGLPLQEGPVLERGITGMRSVVVEPMRHGRLFLAGDSAHIVPPTGAKGLNLAASDVSYLSDALIVFYKTGQSTGIEGYSDLALARVWKSERFSWYLTKLMHRFPGDGAFERKMQRAELDYVAQSEAMQTAIAENYVGLPL